MSDSRLIAEVINDLYMGHENWNRGLEQVATKFADRLGEADLNFDRNQFMEVAMGPWRKADE